MSGEISTDFKSSDGNEISCSSFIAFLLIWAPCGSGGGGRGGGIWGHGRVGGSRGMGVASHTHKHTCMHAHAHVKHVNKHDTHEGGHLQFLYMYILG